MYTKVAFMLHRRPVALAKQMPLMLPVLEAASALIEEPPQKSEAPALAVRYMLLPPDQSVLATKLLVGVTGREKLKLVIAKVVVVVVNWMLNVAVTMFPFFENTPVGVPEMVQLPGVVIVGVHTPPVGGVVSATIGTAAVPVIVIPVPPVKLVTGCVVSPTIGADAVPVIVTPVPPVTLCTGCVPAVAVVINPLLS